MRRIVPGTILIAIDRRRKLRFDLRFLKTAALVTFSSFAPARGCHWKPLRQLRFRSVRRTTYKHRPRSYPVPCRGAGGSPKNSAWT